MPGWGGTTSGTSPNLRGTPGGLLVSSLLLESFDLASRVEGCNGIRAQAGGTVGAVDGADR